MAPTPGQETPPPNQVILHGDIVRRITAPPMTKKKSFIGMVVSPPGEGDELAHVVWQNDKNQRGTHEEPSNLIVEDRTLLPGDVVRSCTADGRTGHSGIVMKTNVFLDLEEV